MQEPEIIARIKELKGKLESEKDKQLAEFDKHGERLAKLEEDFGFDLDIATDIYGDALIDPLDTKGVLEKWEQLLSEIKANPGGDLLLVRQVEVSTGIHSIDSIAHDPNLKYHENAVEVALVKDVHPEDIAYVPADPDNNVLAHIAVLGDVLVSYPTREPGSSRGLIEPPGEKSGLMLAEQTEGVQILHVSSGIASYDVTFLYNPTPKEADQLINSKIDNPLKYPANVLGQIREKPALKS